MTWLSMWQCSVCNGQPNNTRPLEVFNLINSLKFRNIMTTERLRYSDEELQEFKELINEKLDKAKREFENLRSVVMNSDGNGVADTSPTFKVLEEGAGTRDKEEAARMAQRQRQFIQHLQDALIRIENKTYGVCRVTGKLIPKERLRAVPHATLSVEAKTQKR